MNRKIKINTSDFLDETFLISHTNIMAIVSTLPPPHHLKTLKLNNPRNLRKRSLSDSKFKQIGNARETTHSVKEFTAAVSTRPASQ